MAIGHGELMHECFPKHSRMGTTRTKGWYCGTGVFGLIGCISLFLSLALPTSFNNNNYYYYYNQLLTGESSARQRPSRFEKKQELFIIAIGNELMHDVVPNTYGWEQHE